MEKNRHNTILAMNIGFCREISADIFFRVNHADFVSDESGSQKFAVHIAF